MLSPWGLAAGQEAGLQASMDAAPKGGWGLKNGALSLFSAGGSLRITRGSTRHCPPSPHMHLRTWGSRFQGQPKEVGKGFRNAGGWLWIGWDSPRHSFPASRLWPRWPRATGVPTAPPLGKLRVDSSHRAQPSLRQLLHPQQATWDVPRAMCSRGAGGPRALHCPLTSGSHAAAHGARGHRRVRSPTDTHGAAVRGPGSRGPGTLRVDGDGLVGVSQPNRLWPARRPRPRLGKPRPRHPACPG